MEYFGTRKSFNRVKDLEISFNIEEQINVIDDVSFKIDKGKSLD